MGNYVLNQETQKIELRFSKPEYLAVSEDQKKEIKSNFLWSGRAGAWVSRSINHHWRAEQVAVKLGFENAGKVGERLSYAETLEVKAEKAEARAERYEQYSENAEKRAENLQSDFNKYRKDWSWLTQPIIAGHAGSQSFARHRNKVMARYDKGFEEYKKSEYYQQRAATARATADNSKLKNRIYLDTRIKECNKNLRTYQKHIAEYEEMLYKIQSGKELKKYSGEVITEEYIENCISERLEKYEWENDKLEFLENCLEEIGGITFSKENIKVGYIVRIARWGRCEIISAGPVNVTFKILDGGAAGGCLTDPYAAIESIIAEKETSEKIENPFQVGEILCKFRPSGNSIYKAYQITKVTASGIKILEIAIENDIPVAGKFIGKEVIQRKVTKSKFSDFIGVYDDNWQLHKYTGKDQEG